MKVSAWHATGLENWTVPQMQRVACFLLDLGVLVGSFVLAYLLRFDFRIPEDQLQQGVLQLPYVVLIQFVALGLTGVYSFIWRYVGIAELQAFLRAAFFSAIPVLAIRLEAPASLKEWRIPLSIIVMDTVLAFGGVVSLRVARRAVWERLEKRGTRKQTQDGTRKRVLMIGAGHAGWMAVREMQGRSGVDLEVKGFVDDDPAKQGAVINGLKVLGSTNDLPALVRYLRIDHVVITIARTSRQDMRRIVEICRRIPVRVRIIPALHEILQGKVELSDIRDVRIEDLLGRPPVHLDEVKLCAFLAGKTVMVTGAGGSIGAELARQVSRARPSSVLLVERAEFALFEIDRHLRDLYPDVSIVPLVADVRDESRMRHILSHHRPQVLLHAAAHKHVPMMEMSPSEAVTNNVLATRSLGKLAGELGVERFVLISTDKAVRPTSVMGASKRLAELVVQDLNGRLRPRYMAVRFGNVMGSTGSVFSIFREEIARGGPVTVTHPDMARYFMTIREAAQLVLEAGAMGNGGEIFILDMGEPVRILDLAQDMIRLSGLKPFEDIDIVFTGVRPGEKLFEELEISGEHITKTHHPKIFTGKLVPYPTAELELGLRRLAELSRKGEDDRIRTFLRELLPGANLGTVDSDLKAELKPA